MSKPVRFIALLGLIAGMVAGLGAGPAWSGDAAALPKTFPGQPLEQPPEIGLHLGRAERLETQDAWDVYRAYLRRSRADLARIDALTARNRADPSRRGCLGKPVLDCVATLSERFSVATGLPWNPYEPKGPLEQPSLFDEFDSKGGLISHTLSLRIGIDGGMNNSWGLALFARITYGRDGLVRSVTADLPMGLLDRPADAGDAAAYALASTIYGPGCDLGGPRGFAELVANRLARSHTVLTLGTLGGRPDVQPSMVSADIDTGRTLVCGAPFSVVTIVSRMSDGSPGGIHQLYVGAYPQF